METKIPRDVLNLLIVLPIIMVIIQPTDARTLVLGHSPTVIQLQDNVCLIALIPIMVILIPIYVCKFVIFQHITMLTTKPEIVKLYAP